MSKLHKVGKVKDAHGLKGDLYVLIFSGEVAWLEDLETFYLGHSEADAKPYTLEKVKAHKEGLMIKAKEVSDRTPAEKLKGQMFYIPAELLVSDEGDTIYLSEIENFDVVSNSEVIGRIIEFSWNGAQDLLVVERADKKKVEIPFVEDFIEEIDFEEQKVFMNLPEGLLEVNDSTAKEKE